MPNEMTQVGSRTSDTDPVEAVAAARGRLRRVLGSWASDLLELRRLGLDRPGYRPMACLNDSTAGARASHAPDEHRDTNDTPTDTASDTTTDTTCEDAR